MLNDYNLETNEVLLWLLQNPPTFSHLNNKLKYHRDFHLLSTASGL